jgi:hypothetical protein
MSINVQSDGNMAGSCRCGGACWAGDSQQSMDVRSEQLSHAAEEAKKFEGRREGSIRISAGTEEDWIYSSEVRDMRG